MQGSTLIRHSVKRSQKARPVHKDKEGHIIPASLYRFAHMIEYYDDERESGNAIIITLHEQYISTLSEGNVFGEDTVKDLCTHLRGYVRDK